MNGVVVAAGALLLLAGCVGGAPGGAGGNGDPTAAPSASPEPGSEPPESPHAVPTTGPVEGWHFNCGPFHGAEWVEPALWSAVDAAASADWPQRMPRVDLGLRGGPLPPSAGVSELSHAHPVGDIKSLRLDGAGLVGRVEGPLYGAANRDALLAFLEPLVGADAARGVADAFRANRTAIGSDGWEGVHHAALPHAAYEAAWAAALSEAGTTRSNVGYGIRHGESWTVAWEVPVRSHAADRLSLEVDAAGNARAQSNGLGAEAAQAALDAALAGFPNVGGPPGGMRQSPIVC